MKSKVRVIDLMVGTGEAGRMLGVTRRRVTELVRKGAIKKLPLPGRKHVRIALLELQRFAQANHRDLLPVNREHAKLVKPLIDSANESGDIEAANAIEKAMSASNVPDEHSYKRYKPPNADRCQPADEVRRAAARMAKELTESVAALLSKLVEFETHGGASHYSHKTRKALEKVEIELQTWQDSFERNAKMARDMRAARSK